MKINNRYDIRSGADSDNGNVYVDRRIPQYSPKIKDGRGLPANLWKYLSIHETVEADAMKRGVSYDRAHSKIATPTEKKAVQADGVDWKKYTEEIDGYLDRIEKEKVTRPPPKDLHVDPDSAAGHHHSRNK